MFRAHIVKHITHRIHLRPGKPESQIPPRKQPASQLPDDDDDDAKYFATLLED
jgi:hypothetical protein